VFADKWFEILVAAVVAVLAYFFKRELGRMDKMASVDDLKATKDDVKAALARLDAHLGECREQNKNVADTLLHVSSAVARIEGRLDSR
jgi:Tfp pilus assembly protein PilO